jgi:hypothetical protein
MKNKENSGKENHLSLSIILFRYAFSEIVFGGIYPQRTLRGLNFLRI